MGIISSNPKIVLPNVVRKTMNIYAGSFYIYFCVQASVYGVLRYVETFIMNFLKRFKIL